MKRFLVLSIVTLAFTAPAAAQSKPQNPCAAKPSAQNPCAMKGTPMKGVAVNPCHAKMGTVFHVADPMGRNTVTFKSEAPLEDIIGTSNQVTGYVVFDPANPARGAKGQLSVPVASLQTGIPLRDEHLRSQDWLDAGSSPDITFSIDEVKDVRIVKDSAASKTFDARLVGVLSLHGRSKRLEVPARVTYLRENAQTQTKRPGNLVAGRTSFDVALKDFDVRGMQGVVGSKVSDVITIDVSFVASDRAPERAGR